MNALCSQNDFLCSHFDCECSHFDYRYVVILKALANECSHFECYHFEYIRAPLG